MQFIQLDIGLDIIFIHIRIDDQLRHMGRQAWNHPLASYHAKIVRKPLNGSLVFVDKLFGRSMMYQTEGCPVSFALLDHFFSVSPGLGVVVNVDPWRINKDDPLPGSVFCQMDTCKKQRVVNGCHQCIDACLQKDLQQSAIASGVLFVLRIVASSAGPRWLYPRIQLVPISMRDREIPATVVRGNNGFMKDTSWRDFWKRSYLYCMNYNMNV
jgi:hypothetical protein